MWLCKMWWQCIIHSTSHHHSSQYFTSNHISHFQHPLFNTTPHFTIPQHTPYHMTLYISQCTSYFILHHISLSFPHHSTSSHHTSHNIPHQITVISAPATYITITFQSHHSTPDYTLQDVVWNGVVWNVV